MRLQKNILESINKEVVEIPPAGVFELPEKVLQFGTGVLLRGLPDYFIDKANKKGIFNGRIVVVKSTESRGADAFDEQDSLYTLCIRGISEGKKIAENNINASISRVISARNDWEAVMQCAANPEMSVIISNTTEVGITLVKDNIHALPPESFPGKLLAFLYQRFKIFKGDTKKGMVIIPTELIPDNGDKLESIVMELAHQHGLESGFMDWLENCNYFCNSLVDCIVPGKLPATEQQKLEESAGYTDELMIMSEVYRLWAIETSEEKVRETLSFSTAVKGMVLAPDIHVFRELKLRLLNGSHTFSCGLAHLAGFKTVKEAMGNELFSSYISKLMYSEIGQAVLDEQITKAAADDFAASVLDRFRNPFLEHQWLSICLQYSSKMKMRNVPLIVKYNQSSGAPGPLMSLGFAAHILFMRCNKGEDGKYYGEWNGVKYPIQDDQAAWYSKMWNGSDLEAIVENILKDEFVWGLNLSILPGFVSAVSIKLQEILQLGVLKTLEQHLIDLKTNELYETTGTKSASRR